IQPSVTRSKEPVNLPNPESQVLRERRFPAPDKHAVRSFPPGGERCPEQGNRRAVEGTRDSPIQKARWGADWTSWRAEFRWSRVMLTRGTVFLVSSNVAT